MRKRSQATPMPESGPGMHGSGPTRVTVAVRLARAAARLATPGLMALPAVAFITLVLSGCSGSLSGTPPSRADTGSVKVAVALPQLPSIRQALAPEVEVSLVNGSTVLKQTSPVVNGRAEASFPRVTVGEWTVTVALKDEAGDAVYMGTGRVAVFKDQQATANIILKPGRGKLDLYIDVSGIPDWEAIAKARLYKDSTNLRSQVDIPREPGTTVIHSLIQDIVPKTYDMMLKFYPVEGDVLYESLWMPVEIRPGKTTVVNWNFPSGSVSITTALDATPPTPTGLTAQPSQDGVVLSWQAVETSEGDLAGYVVYRKELPAGRYEIVGTTGLETTFLDREAEIGVSYQYGITALDLGGNESLRSNEVVAGE
ncbi:MAG TPA: fibronectin type III domain-containing protein [Firmicutes bacterium]|nr:fibronectin type III domain-containing protein [Bacillota bacterium]